MSEQENQNINTILAAEAVNAVSDESEELNSETVESEAIGETSMDDTEAKVVTGTTSDDVIADGYVDSVGNEMGLAADGHDKVNGHAGSDVISTAAGNDLAAGDMVGSEWSYVDGKWEYDASKVASTSGLNAERAYDDVITTGGGDDVLLGNGGNDILYAGAGDDTINAGTGDDSAFGGAGDDLINLEDGNDYAEGGAGADIINAGDGDDIVYGDSNDNLLQSSGGATSFDQFAANGDWSLSYEDGISEMSQNVATTDGDSYEISFELAANFAGGETSGTVEVLWNGEVVGTVTATTGVFETHSLSVTGGGEGELTFREVQIEDPNAVQYDTSGPIISYDKEVIIGGEDVSVAGFAPGQAKLYQVIDGQLKVFDTGSNSYEDAGDPTGIKLNAIGFNQEDDLIYGIAKSNGQDHLGNSVAKNDIMMLDADGNAYRIGEGDVGDYVGDFDDSGNLWTFQSGLNRVSKVDVDNLDADGNPEITHFDLPNGLFEDRTYDIAYNSDDNAFYAVVSPPTNGGQGEVFRIDMSDVENGGDPEISSIPITGTLYGDEMAGGMAKGAYGAVFLDGDGNLFYGLNRGDHDLDASTESQGAIFKVNMDWDAGSAYSEFMAEAQSTGSNDGAVDPRSADAFAEVDSEAPFLIRNPEVVSTEGGNDDLRGGDGNDLMFGGTGDDTLSGGDGNDTLSGDEGADKIYGGAGDDVMSGGDGNDRMLGGDGNDDMSGGAGTDYINAGSGADTLSGGDGEDKLVGGSGSDTIEGGAGNDHLWGGNWWKDGASDTFVVSSGSGKDMIHDFEADKDVLDLSSYGVEFSDLQGAMVDKGWATEIDLSGLAGGQAGDKLIIKSVDPDDLDESNFLL